jgi:hypothetical protein
MKNTNKAGHKLTGRWEKIGNVYVLVSKKLA